MLTLSSHIALTHCAQTLHSHVVLTHCAKSVDSRMARRHCTNTLHTDIARSQWTHTLHANIARTHCYKTQQQVIASATTWCCCFHMTMHMLIHSTVAAAFVPYCIRSHTVQLMSPCCIYTTHTEALARTWSQSRPLDRLSTGKQVCQLWRQPVPKMTSLGYRESCV